MAIELGQAFVQIMPSSKGISGSIQKLINPEASEAGTSGGKKFGGMFKKVVAAAGLGLVIKKSIEEGAKLEQTIGGVETLFKGSADAVRKYADEAYRTAGLSGNEYMESVTGFAASLLQSLGGDTDKAAKISNRAMIDMADNSNKMGSSMESIQNAYQGFAKQNYTMLDNLKLGYGGTKTEMSRLLKDAQKISGVKYNIDNLADVYTAVGVIQDQLGITGTTALEAEETISGSLNSMKASFTDVLGKLALGEDIKPSLAALSSTLSIFLFKNFIPMIGNIVVALPGAMITFMSSAIPMFIQYGGELLSSITEGLVTNAPIFFENILAILNSAGTWIKDSMPSFLSNGIELISNLANGLLESLPIVLSNAGKILTSLLSSLFDAVPLLLDAGFQLIKNMAKGLIDNFPAIKNSITEVLSGLLKLIVDKYPEYLKKGYEILGKLAKGLWDNLPTLIKTGTDLVVSLIKTISSHLPSFLGKGIELLGQLAIGLIKAIPGLISKVPSIISALLGSMASLTGSFFNIGIDLIKGLWNGISSVKDWILSKIGGFVDNILGGVKKFFGIKSPSRLFADEVGKFLPSGIALGIEANTKPLTKTMEDLSDLTVSKFDIDSSMGNFETKGLKQSNDHTLLKTLEMLTSMISNPAKYQVVLESGVVAGELTPHLDQNFSENEDMKRRGI